MIANEDLGLSLSLSFFPPPLKQSQHHHHQWPHDFAAVGSNGLSHLPTSHLLPRSEGIDVNQAPAGEREGDSEGEGDESSPNNSAVSSVSGKRDAGGGGQGSDDEDGDGSRKKLRLSKDQSAILEESFKEHNTLNPVSPSSPSSPIFKDLLVISKLQRVFLLKSDAHRRIIRFYRVTYAKKK